MRYACCVLIVAVQFVAIQTAFAAPDQWSGSIRVDQATVYDAPGGTAVGSLAQGTSVSVSAWQHGPPLTSDNFTWADIGDGRFVHSAVLRHAPLSSVPPPLTILSSGHWADANLTQQVLTLYDGVVPVHMAVMNSGRPGWETSVGVWSIDRRVANERMRGAGYDIGGVLFTQYFTADGEALHLNYWLADADRGVPRSHGCLGLTYDDAQFAWDFLSLGSLVYVHS
jgi:hypothetical protein